MKQYLDLVRTILEQGNLKPNRTGIDTLSYFAYPFRHDLQEGFPLLTTKKMDGKLWNSMVHELLWFMSGENHIRNLREKTHIWDAWADDDGNLETAYGFYWRHFPSTGGRMVPDIQKMHMWDRQEFGQYEYTNIDQLAWCIDQLKTNPNNRRLVVSAWEPANAINSKLPPCHLLFIFNVQAGRLCLQVLMRSVDCFLGFPFNLASYALLDHIVAQEVGLIPGILSFMLTDVHIYIAGSEDDHLVNGVPACEYDHEKVCLEQLKREPYPLPQIKIAKKPWNTLQFADFQLVGYQSHPRLKARVAV